MFKNKIKKFEKLAAILKCNDRFFLQVFPSLYTEIGGKSENNCELQVTH